MLSHCIRPTSSNHDTALPESGIPLFILTSQNSMSWFPGILPQYFLQSTVPEIESSIDVVKILSPDLPAEALISRVTSFAFSVLINPWTVCLYWLSNGIRSSRFVTILSVDVGVLTCLREEEPLLKIEPWIVSDSLLRFQRELPSSSKFFIQIFSLPNRRWVILGCADIILFRLPDFGISKGSDSKYGSPFKITLL